MELNFLCWLYVTRSSRVMPTELIPLRDRLGLNKVGALEESDYPAITLRVFWR